MKTSELTERALLQWADEEITCRLETIAILKADSAWCADSCYRPDYYDGEEVGRNKGINQGRCEMATFLESLRNNIRLGLRVIDGKLPELGDRPWTERDADHDNNPHVPVVGYQT